MRNIKIKVRALIIKDGKILCVKLKPYEQAVAMDFWCLPGGTVDPFEPIVPALEREITEELGVKADVGTLFCVHQFKIKDIEYLEFFFTISNPDAFENIDLSKTSHGQSEIAELDFIDPTTKNLLPEFLQSVDFSNTTDGVKFFNYL